MQTASHSVNEKQNIPIITYWYTLIITYWYTLIITYWYTLIITYWYTLIITYWYTLIITYWYTLIITYWYTLIITYWYTLIITYWYTLVIIQFQKLLSLIPHYWNYCIFLKIKSKSLSRTLISIEFQADAFWRITFMYHFKWKFGN